VYTATLVYDLAASDGHKHFAVQSLFVADGKRESLQPQIVGRSYPTEPMLGAFSQVD
jgi:hypothetical protein